jgi:TIR domain-containing protein
MPGDGAPIIRIIAASEDARSAIHITRRITRIIDQLTQRGFTIQTTWPDQPGADMPLLTLIVVAPASNRAPTVREEAKRALASGARVAPLLLVSRNELPSYLARLQWVDFSGVFEDGWLDLLAALDRAGVTRYPLALGEFDWEVALARAYRGLLPPDWRAYRTSPTYYTRRASNALVNALAILPPLLCALGVILPGTLYPLLRAIPGYTFTEPMAVAILVIGIVAVAALATIGPARATRDSAALHADRSEIFIFSPDGFGLRTRNGDTVRQFRDLLTLEQVSDPPRPSLTSDLGPERGLSGLRGEFAGALLLRYPDGAEETVPLGDRFPDRTSIAQQIAAMFSASHGQRGLQNPSPAMDTASTVFISHARKDRVAVDRFDEVLRLAGYQTWVDRSMLAGGEDWSRELRQAIASSAALVVVVSPASLASPVVREEYDEALRLGIPVLAVLLKPARRIPEALRSRLRADISAGVGAASWRRGWAPLLLALEQAGARPEDPSVFNAHLTIARALGGAMDPRWRAYPAPPLGRAAGPYIASAMIAAPLIGLAVSLALGANGWILAAWGSLALLLGWQWLSQLWMRYGLIWLLVITPTGAAMLRAEELDSYSWADFDTVRVVGPDDAGAAHAGAVLLKLRATGREQPIAYMAAFTPLERVGGDIVASFQAYCAIHPSGQQV